MFRFFKISLLLPYSLIQIFGAGYLDTLFSSPAVLISVCLIIASVSMSLSGFMESIVFYCLCLAISGLAQGPIWPACAKLMSSVCPSNKKASVLGIVFCTLFITNDVILCIFYQLYIYNYKIYFEGLLSTALFTGAFASTAFASYILEKISWRYFYIITLLPCLCIAFLVASCFKGMKSYLCSCCFHLAIFIRETFLTIRLH